MKKLLLFLIISISFCSISKADTIDIIHIYYNNIKIKECGIFCKDAIVLKLDSIKDNDSITVRYFRDTPCTNCDTYLTIDDEASKLIIQIKGKGIWNPLTFRLNDIKSWSKFHGIKLFNVYYMDNHNIFQEEIYPIFKIKLE